MTTNTYYIIAGIAILFFVYLLFMKKMAAKNRPTLSPGSTDGTTAHSNTTHQVPTPAALDERKRKLLAYGAILAYYRSEELLGITPTSNVNVYVQGLQEAWGISNTEQAHERISALITRKRSTELDADLVSPSADVAKIRKKIAKELKLELNIVEETTSTYGWDIGRAIPLIKWCYWAEYISESECWKYMEQAAEVAQMHGKNWTDYTVSFLLGRTMQGFDLDDISVEASFILNGVNPRFGKVNDIDVYSKYAFK